MRSSAIVWCAVLTACGSETVPEADAPPEPVADAQPEADADGDGIAAVLTEAGEAYNAGEYDRYIELMEQVVAAGPTDGDGDGTGALYNLACGYALAGRTDDAIATLDKLLDAKADFGAAQDPDFRSLRDDPRFVALVEKFAALYPTISTSTKVAELDTFDVNPEGIAWDAANGRYLVSSIAQSKVVAVMPDGTMTDFAKVDADGLPMAVLGLKVDADDGLLYAVGNHGQNVDGFVEDKAGTTGVFVFDLATGENKRAVVRAPIEGEFGFNDLVVSSAGDVYLSGGGGLWTVPAGATEASEVKLDRELEGTNGITFGDSEGTLYLSSRKELLRIDLAAGTSVALTGPEGEAIAFFDGMYYTDGTLAGIQLGQRWRAVQLTLDGDTVTNVRIIEQSTPGLTGATTGTLVGDELHYLSRRRPTDAELASIPEFEQGLANKPVIMKARLETAAAVTEGD